MLLDDKGRSGDGRQKKKGARKIPLGGLRKEVDSKLQLGKDATNLVLSSRGCPDGLSPKRPSPMNPALQSPASKKKKRGRAQKHQQCTSQNQQRLTDMWKQ